MPRRGGRRKRRRRRSKRDSEKDEREELEDKGDDKKKMWMKTKKKGKGIYCILFFKLREVSVAAAFPIHIQGYGRVE